MPEIRRIDIPQLVNVRKYEVDCEKLKNLLREHKKIARKSNKAIADALDVPVTKVEHWFRTDSCFAIPDAEAWAPLKTALAIATVEFDESITTFEERPGVYEKSERCYFADGIAPTLTSTSAGNEKIIVEGNQMVKVTAAAMRGRYNDQCKIEEQLYLSDREYANAIVSTQVKASMIAEPSFVNGDICKTVRAGGRGSLDGHSWDIVKCNNTLQIRKLTPKECFRLMGFDDADYEKAAAVNSNTQLYKQAGNSIVVPVVQHIMSQLIQCGALNG